MDILEIVNSFFPVATKAKSSKKKDKYGFAIHKSKQLALTDEERKDVDNKLCSIELTNDIKCKSHPHVLKKHPDGHKSGWNCDKIHGVKNCLSGMTDFHMATLAKP